jgi:hypothetical protein
VFLCTDVKTGLSLIRHRYFLHCFNEPPPVVSLLLP